MAGIDRIIRDSYLEKGSVDAGMLEKRPGNFDGGRVQKLATIR